MSHGSSDEGEDSVLAEDLFIGPRWVTKVRSVISTVRSCQSGGAGGGRFEDGRRESVASLGRSMALNSSVLSFNQWCCMPLNTLRHTDATATD